MQDHRARHYRTLGLQPDASSANVKRAYRRLAKQLHPDHHMQDDPYGLRRWVAQEQFKLVTEAYHALLAQPAPVIAKPSNPGPRVVWRAPSQPAPQAAPDPASEVGRWIAAVLLAGGLRLFGYPNLAAEVWQIAVEANPGNLGPRVA